MSRPPDALSATLVSCSDYLACQGQPLRRVLTDPDSWHTCWPRLQLRLTGRGSDNWHWAVTGPERGTAEWYACDLPEGGVVLHWYLRVLPARTAFARWRQSRRLDAIAMNYRARIWELKDAMERSYPAGEPGRLG